MASFDQRSVRNHLLAGMAPGDFALLEPHLARVRHKLRDVLITPRQPFTHVFFPETGLASILADTDEGRVEVGMVGREGMVGISVLLGVDQTPQIVICQHAGDILKLGIGQFRHALAQSPTLKDRLLLYVYTVLMQMAQTAFSNASFTIEARLARWILLTRDRVDTDELSLTHEFLSLMLGVQRSGVTLATQALEGSGLIRAARGRITVVSRAGLEALAGDAYGLAESEYSVHLMGT